ncbi:hypothetical protein CDD81_2622 [Ophiocordyceps australis]|uniref:Spp2/MOS2 G-patch domain-containing protein n=1 Tax=Ophiocordyceps australis TaxID=1399860 RepID=A0A2C5XEJ4_9HYPO|nr:hypothetical protein CDD81_2622 [Ophiocordyceps australis]
MADIEKTRVAIKFGAQSTSSSSKPSVSSSTLSKRPRQNAFDDDSDSDGEPRVRHEQITTFESEDLGRQPGRSRRADSTAKNRNGQEASKNGANVDKKPADDEKLRQNGLVVRDKEDVPEKKEQASTTGALDGKPTGHSNDKTTAPSTLEDKALASLLGNPSSTRVKHVIQLQTAGDGFGAPSTSKDREAIDYEDFGDALLRGMGWDGEKNGSGPEKAARRANLLGLGAKELKGPEDLGAWGNGTKKKRTRLDDYNREAEKRKDSRGNEDSYKRQRERERERDLARHDSRHRDMDYRREQDRYRNREGDEDRHRDQYRDRRR